MEYWNVRRRGRALRVEIEPTALERHEEDAILHAVEAETADNGFDTVHVTGTMLDGPAKGATGLIRSLGLVAQRHGKRLEVGPI